MSRERDYINGLIWLGLSPNDVSEVSQALSEGKLPDYLVDVVIERYDELDGLHPDTYPWDASIFDEISIGMDRQGVDTDKVWENTESYVKEKYGKGMPADCATDLGTSEAITIFFEFYVLLQNYNLDDLRKEKEIRF